MQSDFASEKALVIQNKVPWEKCGAFPLWYLMGKTNYMLKKISGRKHGQS